MSVRNALLLIVLFMFPARGPTARGADAPPAAPHWIWAPQSGEHSDTAAQDGWRFKQQFRANGAIRRAMLRAAADHCGAELKVNRTNVLRLEAFGPTTEVDVTPHLLAGENQIEIAVTSTGAAPAVAAQLVLEMGAGEHARIITDGSWQSVASWPKGEGGGSRAPRISVTSLGSASPELWGIGRRSTSIDPFDNYEQWRQALGDKGAASAPVFWTAPGFEITELRTALAGEGSWVSMAFDPEGRLTVAREEKGLLRMTLAEDGRSVARVETINDELLECRGLLYAHSALYASANNSKGLYRLSDADGDGRFEEVRLLRDFPGGVGHGRNDLALGPDGMIYWIHGDSVDVPAVGITDRTSPLREARRGEKTSEGWLLRTDAEGTKWEVVCGGMRNPFGIAFNPAGDLFTYDADAEFDMGAPWYRPTRVLQLRSGADFGWRGVTGKWPPYYPDHADNALPVLDIGKGSPTAVAFGTGSKFPPPYQDALFILDWAYGRVLAVHLAPRGAGYRAAAETFLKGRPLNVTDLAFGPDGAMYLITGGRKTQSALYKVTYVGRDVPDPAPGQHELNCREQASKAKELLRRLEDLHRASDRAAIDFAWPHLENADPVIRHAARIAIEHQPLAEWRERALAEQQTTAALEALLALARSEDKQAFPRTLERLIAFQPSELSVGQLLALLHLYELALVHAPDATAAAAGQIIAQLEPAFAPATRNCLEVSAAGTSRYAQRRLADLLARLDAPFAVEKTVGTLLHCEIQEDRLQAIFSMRHARTGWTLPSRRAYFAALNEGGHLLGGDGMPRFLTQIREEAVATLSEAERTALGDMIAAPTATADESDIQLLQRPLVKAWTIDDFAPRLGESRAQGDAERGEKIFELALCVRCHRVGARGPAVGPDLTHVAGRFSRRDILESILTPDRVVAENYRNVQVLLTDGRVLVGRVLSEGDFRSETLRLAADPLRPSQVLEISKREIDKYQLAEASPMPRGLVDSFTVEEVLDLLAYLHNGAAPKK
jgi:putative heme-binding domain-containing protein